MKKIAVLGSTGSIGTQALSVIDEHEGDFLVTAISAGKNVRLAEKQIRKFRPKMAAMADEAAARELSERAADIGVKVLAGESGVEELAGAADADIAIGAIVGMAGIRPTIAAINSGKDIALANKETLVCAGHIIMPLAREKGVRILPVDSEHSAIFQSMQGSARTDVDKILLTASGGPFRGYTKEKLENVTIADALRHPNWSMGNKVTIDSASMVNKGLEVMEAGWLFGVDTNNIEVLVHPQSIVHSMVQYRDGAVIAQLGVPDMRLPIQYALYYPARPYLSGERLDLFKVRELTFEKPDPVVFPGLALAAKAAGEGGTAPTVFNAANEKAVSLFLDEAIGFTGIPEIISECMEHFPVRNNPDIGEIFDTEKAVHEFIESRSLS